MGRRHSERLTAVDAGFLHQEGPTSHMHVGALTIFEGPPPRLEDVLELLRARMHLIPRHRQRLAVPPAGTGRPLWVDDAGFVLESHVRRWTLAPPGDEAQLLDLAASIFAAPLDRARPLWELGLVDGVEGGRFALVNKSHHAMTDGIAGIDLARVVFDLSAVPAETLDADQPWQPAAEPTPLGLLATGARGTVRGVARTAGRVARAVSRPRASLGRARAAAEGIGEVARALLHPAPRTPLNVPIGPDRRFAVVREELDDFRAVRNAFGGTVNDVLLGVVSGALRAWLRSRGERTQDLELQALVPVSIRGAQDRGVPGNRLVAMRGPLPVHIEDPVARLQAVCRAMDGLKQSRQAVGVAVLAGAQNLLPPAVLAHTSRLMFSTRLFNVLVTNVPGPQFPLYLRGRELLDAFPIAFLPRGHALAVAIMSYNGQMNFGLLGDREAMADLDVVAEGIEASLDELKAAARRAATAAEPDGAAPTMAPSRAAP
jgi:diacylglycerol O-acyltransferase